MFNYQFFKCYKYVIMFKDDFVGKIKDKDM